MSIPADIQAKSDEADAALAEFEKEQGGKDEGGTLGELLLDEPPKPSATPAAAPELGLLQKQLEYERHRNDSLQGRVDSQLRTQNELVQQLRAEIAQLKAQPQRPVDPLHKRVMSAEELEAVGERTAELNSRLATTAAQEAVAQARAEMEARMAQLEQAQAQSRSAQSGNAFWAAVERLAPGSRAANDSSEPGWVTFLNGVDSASGKTRMELGEAAVAAGDVHRVAQLYQEYAGKPKPDASHSVRPAPVAQGQDRPKRKASIRESEMKKFYEDLQRGRYAGQEEKAKQIEKAIEDAVLEGRILPG